MLELLLLRVDCGHHLHVRVPLGAQQRALRQLSLLEGRLRVLDGLLGGECAESVATRSRKNARREDPLQHHGKTVAVGCCEGAADAPVLALCRGCTAREGGVSSLQATSAESTCVASWTQHTVLLHDDIGFDDDNNSVRFTGFHYTDWYYDGDDIIMAVRTCAPPTAAR